MVLKLKDKLIAFPEEVLDTLADYKKKTGVSASNYIRNATIRRMITDGLIWFEMKTVVIKEKSDGKKLELTNIEGDQANRFCDGDSCEIPIILEKC